MQNLMYSHLCKIYVFFFLPEDFFPPRHYCNILLGECSLFQFSVQPMFPVVTGKGGIMLCIFRYKVLKYILIFKQHFSLNRHFGLICYQKPPALSDLCFPESIQILLKLLLTVTAMAAV